MPPTNPARRRIATWCVGGYCLTLAVGIAFALALAQAGNWLDGFAWEHDLLNAINALQLSPALDWMLLVLPWFGTSITLIPIIATAAIVLVRRGRSMLAVHLVVVQIGAFTMNPLLKAFFDRPRPGLWEMRGQFAWASYPSGHAIASVAVLFTMAIVLHRERGWRWPFGVATVLLVLTAYSRLYLGVHWPTDVIGGLMMGLVWLIVTLIAFRPDASATVRELDGP